MFKSSFTLAALFGGALLLGTAGAQASSVQPHVKPQAPVAAADSAAPLDPPPIDLAATVTPQGKHRFAIKGVNVEDGDGDHEGMGDDDGGKGEGEGQGESD